MAISSEPVTIKRYPHQRLYNPVAGSYVTLEDLALMIGDEEKFVVREAGSGEDITGLILRQIILDRARHG